MKIKCFVAILTLYLGSYASSLSALALFPQELYQLPNLTVPQLSQQLSSHISQVLSSGPAQSQENLLRNISLYWQGGLPQALNIDSVLKESDQSQRTKLLDQWYLAKESATVASDIKAYSEKTLLWKRSIRGGYIAPQSSPRARELAIHLLLTMKPQGYLQVLERYASTPDTESQGKYILMRELRHEWQQKETFNIYKAVADGESNAQLKTIASRELLLYIRKL